mmetsp:Transcript_659/g.811  ORF Transcript_659/g.811 Transcript_659/m.811 type:complete len:164 (+) Transcript_659:58-549(+)|eukprot:jgi/Bigna1/91693/estExt_fgenesh1_pg.C_1130040
MPSRYRNPQVDPGDGSDFNYRHTVDPRYKTSAAVKKTMNSSLPAFYGFLILGLLLSFVIPAFPQLETHSQAGIISATSVMPALIIHAALNPKMLSNTLCYFGILWCSGGALSLLLIAAKCLSVDQSLGTILFAALSSGGAVLNAFMSRKLKVLQENAAYSKAK